MKNAQSEDLPMRVLPVFYVGSTKRRANSTLKVFPHKLAGKQLGQLATDASPSPTVRSYLDQFNKVDIISRVSKCQNVYHTVIPKINSERRNKSQYNIDLLEEASTKSKHDNNRQRSSKDRSTQYKLRSKARLQSRSQFGLHCNPELNYSFYNTLEKADYLIDKYRQDQFIEMRSTNRMQNILKRNIATQNILSLLKGKAKLT